MKYLIFYFLLICCFLGCEKNSTIEKSDSEDLVLTKRTRRISDYKNRIDSVNRALDWKETDFGLWKSKNGDLGLKTVEATDVGITIEKFIDTFWDGKPLKEVIDTTTFQKLGSSFYKDKNHIYTHYIMADGGNFSIVEEADVSTFHVLGDCYAKDKNYIFGERALKMDSVDYETFKTCLDCGCYAKDKTGFYFWDDKIDETEITDEITLQMIEKLKKL